MIHDQLLFSGSILSIQEVHLLQPQQLRGFFSVGFGMLHIISQPPDSHLASVTGMPVRIVMDSDRFLSCQDASSTMRLTILCSRLVWNELSDGSLEG